MEKNTQVIYSILFASFNCTPIRKCPLQWNAELKSIVGGGSACGVSFRQKWKLSLRVSVWFKLPHLFHLWFRFLNFFFFFFFVLFFSANSTTNANTNYWRLIRSNEICGWVGPLIIAVSFSPFLPLVIQVCKDDFKRKMRAWNDRNQVTSLWNQ